MRYARSLSSAQLARLDEGDREALAMAVERYEMLDPVAHATLRLKTAPWSRQAEVLRAVRDRSRVAVRSGHKIGKSTGAAMLALWWYETRPRALVVMTSATDDQVRLILWPEVQRLYRLAGGAEVLGGEMHESHRVGLKCRDGRKVVGFGTNKSENMGGFSGMDLLIIADEASGVEDEIFDAIEGNQAGGAKVVMFGNPTRQSGRFYEAFHDDRGFWHQIHISSEETPNVREGRVVIPGLATREYVEEKRAEYGATSPWYQVRVLGDFPDSASDSVVGLDLVARSSTGWREPAVADGRLEVGVDVARFGGDETVIFARRGLLAHRPLVLQGSDVVQTAGRVLAACRELRAPGERPVVRVDGGGVGGGVVDVLRLSNEVELVDANASSSSGGPEHARLRDQLWFGLRDWLRAGGRVPKDRFLAEEMRVPTYAFDLRGRIKVESKDDIRARLKPRRSPDRADALALAVHDRGASSAAQYDSPPYIDEAPDPGERAIARRLEEICSGW